MGHAIGYFYLKAKTEEEARKEGLRIANEYAFNNVDRQENPSGSYHGNLLWFNRTFDCEDDAKAFFESKGSYVDGIVKVRQPDPSVLKKAQEKTNKLYVKIRQANQDAVDTFRLRTSTTIACKSCGSRCAKEIWLRNGLYCPVCRNWMATGTIKERVAKLNADIQSVKAELLENQRKSAVSRYFLKVEVHT